jgi:hypothetical protein
VGLATKARDPEDREEKAWPLGMLKVGSKFLSSTWCALLKKGFQNPFQNYLTPYQKQKIPTQKYKAQFVPMDCAVKQQKIWGKKWW